MVQTVALIGRPSEIAEPETPNMIPRRHRRMTEAIHKSQSKSVIKVFCDSKGNPDTPGPQTGTRTRAGGLLQKLRTE
jgi:hypothetical protein